MGSFDRLGASDKVLTMSVQQLDEILMDNCCEEQAKKIQFHNCVWKASKGDSIRAGDDCGRIQLVDQRSPRHKCNLLNQRQKLPFPHNKNCQRQSCDNTHTTKQDFDKFSQQDLRRGERPSHKTPAWSVIWSCLYFPRWGLAKNLWRIQKGLLTCFSFLQQHRKHSGVKISDRVRRPRSKSFNVTTNFVANFFQKAAQSSFGNFCCTKLKTFSRSMTGVARL